MFDTESNVKEEGCIPECYLY